MTDLSYQLYSSRNFQPLPDTLKMLAGLGYSQVEGYGGLFTDDAAIDALRRDLDANGLHMATAHFGLDMVRGAPDRALDIAGRLGVEAVFVPFLVPDDRPKDAVGWRAFGKTLNTLGEPFRNAGLDFGWHNHDFEFEPTEAGEMPLDLILAGGGDLALELDIAWAVRGGQEPIAWIEKHAERVVAVHVKDIAPAGENADEDGWADVGHGVMDWPAIMEALGKTKARYLVMEHDNPSDHARFARRSIETVRALRGEA